MARHLFTIKATVSELNTVISALSRALAEAEADVFEATNQVTRNPDSQVNATYLKLANSYQQSISEARDLFFDLVYSAEDEEGNYPHFNELQEAM